MSERTSDEFWSDPKNAGYADITVTRLQVYAHELQQALPGETVVRVLMSNEDYLDYLRYKNGGIGRAAAEVENLSRRVRAAMEGENPGEARRDA